MQRAMGTHDRHDVLQRAGFQRLVVRIDARGKLMQHAAHALDDPLERVKLIDTQRIVTRAAQH